MPKDSTLKVDKRMLLAIVAFAALLGGLFFVKDDASTDPIKETYDSLKNPTAKKLYYEQSDGLTTEVPQRLIELDEKTIGCFGSSKIMEMSNNDPNLGGQCCGALKDIGPYEIQLQVLFEFIESHGNIDLIPKDPYDINVEQAKQLILFDQNIILAQEQQQAYDKAIKMSHHGGPCCCRCWKWYVMSGLGKKLIVDYGFDADELAELWDISSSCGHDEDTDMFKHYH